MDAEAVIVAVALGVWVVASGYAVWKADRPGPRDE